MVSQRKKKVSWYPRIRFLRWARFKADYKSKLLEEIEKNGQESANKGSLLSHEVHQNIYFRGQGYAEWKLEPSFDRNPLTPHARPQKVKEAHRDSDHLVRQFFDQIRKLEKPDFAPDSVLAKAFAQHHRLPTRLLDWSASPYIAAFFAFVDRVILDDFRGNVSIWALDVRNSRRENDESIGQSLPSDEVKQSTLVNTSCSFFELVDHSNIRMGNQQGAFTHLNDSTTDLCDFLRQSNHTEILTQIVVPAHQAVEALDDLQLMGINWAYLFPDRDGAAKHVDIMSRVRRLRDHLDNHGAILRHKW